MDLISFQTLRGGLRLNVAPAREPSRAAAVERLRALLATSGVFADVEVEATDDGDRLVAGLCRYSPDRSEDEIVDVLTRIWSTELRYRGWEGHSFLVEDGPVELQAATVHTDRTQFLSLHLLAHADPALSAADLAPALLSPLSQVPGQRSWLRGTLEGSVA